jgi:hypothetical protein
MSEPVEQYFQSRRDFEDLESVATKELAQRHLDALSTKNFAKTLNGSVDPTLLTMLDQDERCLRRELTRRREVEKTESTGQSKTWPQFLTAKEILQAPKDPTRWIADECLPVGGASVLVAKPKVGKSTIAAALAISVARGEPWLDRATQQSPVAYVFLDGPLTDIAETFVSLGLRESDPVFIHAGSAPGDAIAWILAAVKDKGSRLVIIDVLQKLCRFQNINDYSEVTTKMEPLLEAARDGSCHIMTLHHAKKDSHDDLDAAIGSTAIRGLCYTYLFVKRLPGTERRILSSDQRGGKNIPELAIGFGRGGLEVQGTRQEAEIDETRPMIKELLEGAEAGMSEREIRNEVQARGIVVSKALRAMFKDFEVERTGKGKKGEAYRYHLAASLISDSDKPLGLSLPSSSLLLSSSSLRGSENSGRAGIESEKNGQPRENAHSNAIPKNRELNGKSREENGIELTPGTESALRIFGGRVV